MADPKVGTALSMIALAVTVIGFGFTIWTAVRSKNAAEAARDAAATARARMARIDAIAEAAAARVTIEDVKRLHRDKNWPLLPEKIATLKVALINLRHAPGSDDERRETLQSVVQQLATIENLVEKQLADPDTEHVNTPKVNKILSQQVDRISEVLAEIRSEED